jgi:alpha-tubulin suppressor-like RCC1 family protein
MLDDLPLEVLTAVCQQLDLHDLVRVAETCKRFRHGDGGLETAELPTKSPVISALREHAFPRPELIPSMRPMGCSESWVAYLARCARQRRCREATPIAASLTHTLFVDPNSRLLACGYRAATGDGDAVLDTFLPLVDAESVTFLPTPVAAMAGVWVRSIDAGYASSLALGWDGRVYSWGRNKHGQLGQGDKIDRPSPALVEGLEDVRGVVAGAHCVALTQSGAVFTWGSALQPEAQDLLRPILVEGFSEVRVSHVRASLYVIYAIGEDGEFFSWGRGLYGLLGHGDKQDQTSPKHVDALRGVGMSSVSVGLMHLLALAEDGLVYAWGKDAEMAVSGNPHDERELLPKPVEALRGVRVGSVAAAGERRYAVADTGELWAWGACEYYAPLGHGEQCDCPLPKAVESLRGVKVDAMAATAYHTLALADDGSVYTWGGWHAANSGLLGLGSSVRDAVHSLQRIPALRVACGLGRDSLVA